MESKLFGEADDDWIESVTGIDTKRRLWNTYTIDDSIVPSPSFKDRFDQISRVFHLEKEAGRRIYLNLFLADIVDREEFQGKLRIFPELEMSITKVVGGKRRKLGGKHDYTIGFGQGLDPFGQKTPPKELHLVAIEGSRNWEEQNLWQCVAEAATIFRVRKDAKKAKCSVWGVLTNATDWIFIHIDEDGKLHRSDKFLLNLPYFRENEVFFIYRLLYHVVDQCFRACTPPGSEESLNAANHAENDDNQ
ncbi:hypothetical protein O9G_006078 [Rozella allomycis CSF55]|uniref:Fungal-type protein kinase domain-containing protein n=1 Tax=Rozella allomycis (strain CSF55) TaxID=988480 RepID=A0A075B5A3_ROZAC|nr:hypothetical protein O9G_006078 [Rozella allomycis CSF55]|eukprot:EPZ36900.1 hypothetical protein O9G_006078 [Rozella allomycis CSF55]